MSCDAFRPLLSDLVDGSLSPEDRRRLDGHLVACEPCRNELEELASLEDALRAGMPVVPPSGASSRVADAVWRRRSPSADVPAPLVALAAAAFAVLVLAVARLTRTASIATAADVLKDLSSLRAPSLDGLISLVTSMSEAVLGSLEKVPSGLLLPLALGLVSLQLLGSLALARRRPA